MDLNELRRRAGLPITEAEWPTDPNMTFDRFRGDVTETMLFLYEQTQAIVHRFADVYKNMPRGTEKAIMASALEWATERLDDINAAVTMSAEGRKKLDKFGLSKDQAKVSTKEPQTT